MSIIVMDISRPHLYDSVWMLIRQLSSAVQWFFNDCMAVIVDTCHLCVDLGMWVLWLIARSRHLHPTHTHVANSSFASPMYPCIHQPFNFFTLILIQLLSFCFPLLRSVNQSITRSPSLFFYSAFTICCIHHNWILCLMCDSFHFLGLKC